MCYSEEAQLYRIWEAEIQKNGESKKVDTTDQTQLPPPQSRGILHVYEVPSSGEARLRWPTPQQGQRVTSLPVSFFKKSSADSFILSSSFTGVFVSFLQSFSFIALFLELSKP